MIKGDWDKLPDFLKKSDKRENRIVLTDDQMRLITGSVDKTDPLPIDRQSDPYSIQKRNIEFTITESGKTKIEKRTKIFKRKTK